MKGTLTKKKEYPSKTGFFLGIDNKKPDFMFFGKVEIKEGEKVEYEVGEPMPDGKPTIKTIHPERIESFIDKAGANGNDGKHLTSPTAQSDSSPQPANPATKDEIITRLACLKAASEVYSGAQNHYDGLFELARKMEKFAKGN